MSNEVMIYGQPTGPRAPLAQWRDERNLQRYHAQAALNVARMQIDLAQLNQMVISTFHSQLTFVRTVEQMIDPYSPLEVDLALRTMASHQYGVEGLQAKYFGRLW
ncbi:MAG: hypothetical protein WBD02_05070 [Acidimicrobiia bacterium]